MPLQEIYFLTFDLDLWVKVTENNAKCTLYHVTDVPTKFEVTTSKG